MAKKKTSWITEQAIALVDNERKTWENSVVYITEKVAFRMKDLIRTCEKNYWGVFDAPNDPLTGRPKIWYPLTEEVCNAYADNSDLDQKDVGFRTKPGGSYAVTQLTRQLVKNYLDETYFGQDLDDSALTKAITGTAIWKIIDRNNKRPSRRLVNRLNFYIDPTAKSIQEAYRVTERALMFADEIAGMSGWDNRDDLAIGEGLPFHDPQVIKGGFGGNVKSRDVWETWGKIPKMLITGNDKDTEEVDGHIVVSGLEAGNPVCHIIEANKNKDKDDNIIKPYEEDWATRVPGRWDGRGPAEQVIMLQVWINTIINIRVNRSYVSQLGLWKIKRGANITPQSIQKLGANGAVLVSSMDDIEQMIMQEASQSSYMDETNIREIAKRVTRTLESITGEKLPASMSATSASIQSGAAKNAFTKIKERSGFFVERLINRHLIERLIKTVNKKDIIRILNTDDKMDEILDRIAFHYVESYQDELSEMELFLTEGQLEIAVRSAKEQLKQRPELFIENMEDLIGKYVDCSVYISNEELDMGSTVDKLTMAANLLPEQDRADVIKVIFDTMGVPYPSSIDYRKRNEVQQPMQQIPGLEQVMPQ